MQLYVSNNGEYQPATESAVLDNAREVAERKLTERGPRLNGLAQARRLLPALIGHLEHEVLCAVFLDMSCHVIGYEQLSRGSIGQCPAHPREVAKHALRHNAASVLLAHNHPAGGIAKPSPEDKEATMRIGEALALLEINLLDHLVVAGNQVTSILDVMRAEAQQAGPFGLPANLPPEVRKAFLENVKKFAAELESEEEGKGKTKH